jgi:hypothetical protein
VEAAAPRATAGRATRQRDPEEEPLVHERGDGLADEERHAAGLGVQPRRQASAVLLATLTIDATIAATSLAPSGRSRIATRPATAKQRVEGPALRTDARVAEQHHRHPAREPAGDTGHQAQRVRIGAVRVVEQDEHRRLLRHRGQHLHERVAERGLAARRRGQVAEHRCERRHQPRAFGERLGCRARAPRGIAESLRGAVVRS